MDSSINHSNNACAALFVHLQTIICICCIGSAIIISDGCQTPQNQKNHWSNKWSTNGLINMVSNEDLSTTQRINAITELQKRPLTRKQRNQLIDVSATIFADANTPNRIFKALHGLIISKLHNNACQCFSRALLLQTRSENTQSKQIQQLSAILAGIKNTSALADMVIALDRETSIYINHKGIIRTQTIKPKSSCIGQAIVQIANKKLPAVLTDIISGVSSAQNVSKHNINYPVSLEARIAALSCLQKQIGHKAAINTIISIKPICGDVLVKTLQFWAKRFDYLPTNMGRLYMCNEQIDRLTTRQFDILIKRVKILVNSDNYHFDPRDSYLLLNISERELSKNRQQLTQTIANRLHKLGHTKRNPNKVGDLDDYREDFDSQNQRLSICDLLRIDLLLKNMYNPAIKKQIWHFVQLDAKDTSCETGGLSFLINSHKNDNHNSNVTGSNNENNNNNDVIVLKSYKSGYTENPNVYIESPLLLKNATLCFTRWHCHTDNWQDKSLAGPGRADIRYAQWQDCLVVIFTKINNHQFNIDYLTPQPIDIDLGNY